MNEQKVLIYEKWAPREIPWSRWVKPVLFATMGYRDLYNSGIFDFPNVDWASKLSRTTAIIIDLPGEDAIKQGLALYEKQYFPVMLVNCCKSPSMIIDVSPITNLLVFGGEILSQNKINSKSPPAFILDSCRMDHHNARSPGMFDNRWFVLPQDMPSSNYLKDLGIKTILLRSDQIREDLSHILYRYQESDISIKICKDNENIENIKVSKPSGFKGIGYRWSVILHLKRNSAGGFGGIIPDPSSASGGMG